MERIRTERVRVPSPPSPPSPGAQKLLRRALMVEELEIERSRKEQMEEGWDADAVDALRGYAPLSHDATTAEKLEWKHLKHESNQELLERFNGDEEEEQQEQGLFGDLDPQDNELSARGAEGSDSGFMGEKTPFTPRFMSRDSDASKPGVIVQQGRKRRANGTYFPIYDPIPLPEDSLRYRQRNKRPAYVNPGYAEEEILPSALESRLKKRLAKQQHRSSPHATPSGRDLMHVKKDQDILEDAQSEIKALKMEIERLRQDVTKAPVSSRPAYSYKVFHKIREVLYLDEPSWEPAEGSNARLMANNPIRRLDYYLEQHPEIAFAIYKDYTQDLHLNLSEIENLDGTYRSPVPRHEILKFVSPDMQSAIEELVQQIPRFDYYFPHFHPDQKIPAPYLFMYYSIPFMTEVLPRFSTRSRNLIKQLQAVVAKSYGHEYTSVQLQVEKGIIARGYLKYIVRPGDVLVSSATQGNIPQAYIARGWIEAPETELKAPELDEWEHVQKRLIGGNGFLVNPTSSRKTSTYVWKVPVWYWEFDGNFGRRETSLDITMSLANEGDSVEIRSLKYYPLQYAAADMRALLEKRGRTFWSLRNRRFVSYMRSEEDELHNIEDRYIVDTKSFKMLVPDSSVAQMRLKHAFSAAVMANDQPPEEGDALLAVPSTIMAHNLQEKVWKELLVDQITDINWNKQAFKDLVTEPETKELVQALVMKQINARRSTDFVAGKGNGLIMLLHGAPGTGKTFTAEGVAEFAEKPLLRITCGDIGTEPELVDQRLRATLRLGKLWDCVVLLDEADVFLEERDMKDLKRNALVSVFLRALEYYDGILILTSNRVGTFDEAFKSRIQLALHYDNLGPVQRKKIWRNFITRMKKLEESSAADLEDILDHIDELSEEPMNGREIRNAITIARQLAEFRGQSFQYSHLKHAMKVGSRFSKYLKDLRMNYTDDMIKQDSGIRYSYTATPAGLE
ncbi:hypothetical protein GT037_000065 [Alternaria burnsii]|uniref:AAA+ ATPase domain-containing protein n=1 Tax=Alternaria burnsii TaxID=1187904 RepID=A0A8H7BCM0_9PLEO|nr:uncharacterized protein GT037_000065 [Alternaria burnsii]KAF7681089.1 hypothetical protein GT037_000065 [Alternaria burnsii]